MGLIGYDPTLSRANKESRFFRSRHPCVAQPLQINGLIGEKGWWEVSQLDIRSNRAVGRSIQVNHGTSTEVFDCLLAVRATGLT